jgi:hypothetical protein
MGAPGKVSREEFLDDDVLIANEGLSLEGQDEAFDIAEEVAAELDYQQYLWGNQHHPDVVSEGRWHREWAEGEVQRAKISMVENGLTWEDILLEEVHEALAAPAGDDRREELIQVIAVATNWVRDIDSREAEAE